jgi:hypothetical protein
MSKSVIKKLEFIATYANDVTDWVTIKKELIRQIPVNERKMFSKRDSKTKQLCLNDFERQLLRQWKKLTGAELFIDCA